jgi:hypothetical protein
MRCLLGFFALSLVSSLSAADTPVPVQAEPMHRVVFENDYVRMIDVQIVPGATTLFHIHSIPSVVVYLTKSTNRSESWPDHAILNRDLTPGESRYAPYDEKPLTHRVTNTGASLFHVFDIELLRPTPTAKATEAAWPAHVASQWSENRGRGAKLSLDGTAKTEIAANDCAHLVVGTGGAVHVRGAGGKSAAARALKSGEFQFFAPQTAVQLSNAGAEKAEAVLLELRP